MKGLIVSQILLFLLIIIIICNACLVASVRERLLAYVDNLASHGVGAVSLEILDEATEYWEGVKPILSLSVCFGELDAIGGCLGRLRASLEIEDATHFALELETLSNAIEALSRLERISPESIL